MTKRSVLAFFLVSILIITLWSGPVFAKKEAIPSPEDVEGSLESGHVMASQLSQITGISISPLLGLTVKGCIDYIKYRRYPERLPWYSSPWVIFPGLFILVLLAGKETIGEAFGPLKKPLDMADNAQMALIGILAGIATVPGFSDTISQPSTELVSFVFMLLSPDVAHATGEVATEVVSHSGLISTLGEIVASAASAAIFVVVWLASNTINVLTLISPVPFVGGILKSIRLGIVTALTAAEGIHPLFGLTLSIILIVISYIIAYWSFRLTVFGSIIIWDYILRKWRSANIMQEDNIKVFCSKGINKVPVRCYGSILREGENFIFKYRPWLVLPMKKVTLPIGKADFRIAKSLLYPHIVKMDDQNNPSIRLFQLRPKYRKHEVELAEKLIINRQVVDVGVLKGIKSAWNWVKEQFSREKSVTMTTSV